MTNQSTPAPEPLTIVERLDAARDGTEFMGALTGLFRGLERARDEAEEGN